MKRPIQQISLFQEILSERKETYLNGEFLLNSMKGISINSSLLNIKRNSKILY